METLDLILEDKLEIGENLTPPITVSKFGTSQIQKNLEEPFLPEIDYKGDLGEAS
jgi:hypothetical protein